MDDRAFDNPSDIGPVEMGPVPRAAMLPRWARVAQVDLATLPPVKTWDCLRTPEPITIDGYLDEAVWGRAKWTEPFGRMDNGEATPFETRVATLWDDEHLYIAYKVEDPDVRASMTGFNDHVYRRDEDVEFFFGGDGYYYEIGLNALNTSYQIRWTWVERLVREQRFEELEALFKLPDVLYYATRDGERLGRWADLSYQLPGVRHAVAIDGSINNPGVRDRGWTVEMAFPWESLKDIGGGIALPPRPGDTIPITAYRCHHDREKRTAKGWTWSLQGNDNIHIPERWNRVTFRAEEA